MRNVTQLKGNKLADVFRDNWNLSAFLEAKNFTVKAFNPAFNEDSLHWGSAIFVSFVSLKLLLKKHKNKTFVCCSDCYLNIHHDIKVS
jgi:hypothetical protein